jgi:hypothetical protein
MAFVLVRRAGLRGHGIISLAREIRRHALDADRSLEAHWYKVRLGLGLLYTLACWG